MTIRSSLIDRFLLPELFDEALWKGGSNQKFDFICPQAFGRNTWLDSEVGRIAEGRRDESDHDDLAIFESLEGDDFDPGRPNWLLAEQCVRLWLQHNVPIIGQWEVLYAVWQLNKVAYREHRELFCAIWPSSCEYLGTRGMLLEAWRIALNVFCVPKPRVVAHPEHIQRCYFLARKIFGAENVSIWVSSEQECDRCWFDSQSVQWWTRGPIRWLAYEMLVRIHHQLRGWF